MQLPHQSLFLFNASYMRQESIADEGNAEWIHHPYFSPCHYCLTLLPSLCMHRGNTLILQLRLIDL